jgi:hypothetical protein
MFTDETYPDFPEGDQDLGIYKTIICSILHMIVAHVAIFPCVEDISWIIKHSIVDINLVIEEKRKK